MHRGIGRLASGGDVGVGGSGGGRSWPSGLACVLRAQVPQLGSRSRALERRPRRPRRPRDFARVPRVPRAFRLGSSGRDPWAGGVRAYPPEVVASVGARQRSRSRARRRDRADAPGRRRAGRAGRTPRVRESPPQRFSALRTHQARAPEHCRRQLAALARRGRRRRVARSAPVSTRAQHLEDATRASPVERKRCATTGHIHRAGATAAASPNGRPAPSGLPKLLSKDFPQIWPLNDR